MGDTTAKKSRGDLHKVRLQEGGHCVWERACQADGVRVNLFFVGMFKGVHFLIHQTFILFYATYTGMCIYNVILTKHF